MNLVWLLALLVFTATLPLSHGFVHRLVSHDLPMARARNAVSRRLDNKRFHKKVWGLGMASGKDLSSSVAEREILFNLTKACRKQKRSLWRKSKVDKVDTELSFRYHYKELFLPSNKPSTGTTTGVVLIHPIGVGIGNWFYERLFESLASQAENAGSNGQFVFLAPDLLGSGSACNPTMVAADEGLQQSSPLPLLNISDWSDQIIHLMESVEKDAKYDISNWCLVANGGCSPIALKVAATRFVEKEKSGHPEISNVVLSSVPRPPFFWNSTDPVKVQKSYRTLCGIVGRLFWWYSIRKNGKFIQTFSEKNLVANPESLGPTWTQNCVDTAKLHSGRSRYSTFAFLAGTLQDGCVDSLAVLEDSVTKSGLRIDLIKGSDKRQNRAKSWFWQQRKTNSKKGDDEVVQRPTTQELFEQNGNGAREVLIGGRISLAHEDAPGYAGALMDIFSAPSGQQQK